MEIERAIAALEESSDRHRHPHPHPHPHRHRHRRLMSKYRHAVYVIQRAFALYPFDQVAFSFNGGKDSTVLLHLLRAAYYGLHGNETDFPLRTIYFHSPSAFPEINSFTFHTASTYGLLLETIHSDFKSGLEQLIAQKPTQAIFLGTRIGDPNALGQDLFSPSSPGWPPFMRVNPILDWSYRDVWSFLLTCNLNYCTLYDQGYTSIGSIYDTVPNALLTIPDASPPQPHFKPAYMLLDGRLERAGRAKKPASAPIDNAANNVHATTSTASIIVIADEIL